MNLGTWIGIVVFFLSLYVLWQIKQLLLLIFTAVVVADALNILVVRFQKSGLKRGYGIVLSVLLLSLVLTGFFWIVVPPFVAQFQELAQLIPQAIEELRGWNDFLLARLDPRLIEFIPDTEELLEQLQPLANRFLGGGLDFFYSTLGVLLSTLLLLVLTLMFLSDPLSYRQGFIRLFPSFYRRRVDQILDLCDRALQGWLVRILFNMVVITLFSLIGLLILGVRLALAQAMLAGILTFIPHVGQALSVIPPMAIALLDAPWKSFAVLILYIVIQQFTSNFLAPLVVAKPLSLLPVVTLLVQVFCATFFGLLGLFLALPLTIVGHVWVEEVLTKDILDKWQRKSLSSNPEAIAIKEAEGAGGAEEAKS